MTELISIDEVEEEQLTDKSGWGPSLSEFKTTSTVSECARFHRWNL